MPKYISKKNTITESNSSKKIDLHKSVFELKVNKTQLIIIFVISSAIAVFFINQKIKFLNKYLPVSDETEIIRRVTGGIEDTGLPYNIFPKISPNRKLSAKEVREKLHYQKNFREEVYLRYIIFKLADYIPVNWYSFSNLFYFYLILLILIIIVLLKKEIRIPVITISFLILFLGFSHWYSSSFHYVRYYFFVMTAQIISFITVAYLIFYGKKKYKFLFILLIAYIPTEFHPQGAFNFIFWTVVIILTEIRSVFFSNDKKKKEIFYLYVIIALIIFGTILKFQIGIFQIALSKLSLEHISLAIGKFIQLNFPHGIIEIIINVLILIGGIFSYKFLSNFEKILLKYSLIFFIFSTLSASLIVGGNYSGYNGINRYFSFIHATYLIVPAILLSGIFKYLLHKTKKQQFAFILFILISAIFIYKKNFLTDLDYKNYNFSILPYIEKKEAEKIKTELSDINYDVICSHKGNASIAFPHKRTYQINNIKRLKESVKKDTYFFFFRVNPNKLSPELREFYSKIPLFSYNGAIIKTEDIRKYLEQDIKWKK